MEWTGTSGSNLYEIDLYYCGSFCMEVRDRKPRPQNYVSSGNLRLFQPEGFLGHG